MSCNFDVVSGDRAGGNLLTAFEHPDAVFAANGMLAMGLMAPSEIAVPGFKNSAVSAHCLSAMSMMPVDISRFGEQAVHLLLDHPKVGGIVVDTGGDARAAGPRIRPELHRGHSHGDRWIRRSGARC